MRLDVFIGQIQEPIGVLERSPDKSMAFNYATQAPENARLSLALPVSDETYGDAACVAYFGNLLFESRELERIRSTHKIDRDDVAGLLYHLGADCPGAISVMPAGQQPIKRPGIFPDDYDHLPLDEITSIVASLHFNGVLPNGSRDPSPIAGVQPKLAILYIDQEFYLPKIGTGAPTTHILKVSPRENPSITHHEVALMDLAQELGIEAAKSKHLVFEDESTNLKYERDGEGPVRFSAEGVGEIAQQMAVPALFQIEFLRHTVFNLGVGNTDNHGKNGALLYDTPSGRLAPLYDVVPVTMEKKSSHEFAFKVGNAQYAEDLSVADLEAMTRKFGFMRPDFNRHIKKELLDVGQVGIPFLHQNGGKQLADAVAAQLCVIEESLNVDLEIPERDYFPRNVRDQKPEIVAGGWHDFS
jgi:serine/threonine-protein kinase HipA